MGIHYSVRPEPHALILRGVLFDSPNDDISVTAIAPAGTDRDGGIKCLQNVTGNL